MYRRKVFCFFVLIALSINAQSINIHGKVVNKAGTAIAGAIVDLAGQKLKDTTGTDGTYLIKNTVGVLRQLVPQAEKIVLNHGVLELNLTKSSPVKVEIFNVNGTVLKSEFLPDAQEGFYRLNIADNFRTTSNSSTNLLIIHASIGERTMTFRYLPLNDGKYLINLSSRNPVQTSSKLSKVNAISDTLKITAANYTATSIIISSYDTTLDITLDTIGGGPVTVQLDQTKQLIRGFGINNTWNTIGSDIPKCFDSTTGLGMNVLRIGMQPSETVAAYESFDDAKAAAKLGCKYFIGTVWSAPANMKTNNSLNAGGYLKEENYQAWAKAIAKFPSVFKAGSGLDLYAMSPQNETDFASCASKGEPCTVDYTTMLWTGKMYAAFFEIVGPLIKAAGCKAMAPEASEWLHAWSDFSACCSEPGNKGSSDALGCGYLGKDATPKCDHEKGYDYGHWLYANKKAWDAVDIFSTHQYDTQVAEQWPSDVPRTNANGTIEVWQTEMSGVRYWPEQGELSGSSISCTSDIKNGVAVARWIHSALTTGEASAWCYWWWKQLDLNDNEGLTCKGVLTKRYYTFGNFSKYMRPGQKVVTITGTKSLPAKVLLVASKNDAGKVVIVAINETTSAQTVPITISGGTAPAAFTPIVTADGASENWAQKADVPVAGGVLTAQLPAMSVTTFVSK